MGGEKMGNRLKGKVAVVTGAGLSKGASRQGVGIGRAEALALASEGAKVVVNDFGIKPDGTGFSKEPADEVVAEIKKMGGEAVANYDSVATVEGGENIIKTAVDKFGRIDILVNNAGFIKDVMIFNMTPQDWDGVIKVHLYGVYHCTKPAVVLMRQQKSGRIINTSSEAGLFGTFGQANYGSAKEGIIGFTRKVAADLGKYGVTCNAIRPRAGLPMSLKKLWEEQGKISEIELLERNKVEDIAPLVVWLASDESANVNGRTFFVSTGRIGLYSEPVEEKIWVKDGAWTIDEMFQFMPTTLAAGLVNPVAPAPPTEKK
jgi:NAD(P)-dependent dehydrogenase (short-subunit alcohol dehydrogenase family)